MYKFNKEILDTHINQNNYASTLCDVISNKDYLQKNIYHIYNFDNSTTFDTRLYLRPPILPRVNYRCFVLVIVCGTSEIDHYKDEK